jgi:hypothetical protein
MNYEKTTWVPLADVIENISKSKEMQDVLAELNRRKSADPARFELQYSKFLTDQHMAAEMKMSRAVSRFFALNDMRSNCFEDDFDQAEFDRLYEEYHDYVIAAAQNIKSYRDHREFLLKKITRDIEEQGQ